MRTSYTPGIGVLLTSSIGGKFGSRSASVLRIAASSAQAVRADAAAHAANNALMSDILDFFTAYPSKARAANQRLAGVARSTRPIPRLRSSRAQPRWDENPCTSASVNHDIVLTGQARARA